MEDPVYLADEHVLSRMLASEARQEMQSYFDKLQRDFTENDRRELANWMRDVCKAEECQPDIFPLSVLIVDRFLTFVRTKRTQLQLLGAVALLLASKLRQTSQIPAKHLIFYTQDLITLNELKTWELFVLTTLKWDLALITPVDYLDILLRRMKLTDEQMISDIEEDALSMIEQCCLDFKYSLYPPSMIAWASLSRAMEPWKLDLELHQLQCPHLYYDQQTFLPLHRMPTSFQPQLQPQVQTQTQLQTQPLVQQLHQHRHHSHSYGQLHLNLSHLNHHHHHQSHHQHYQLATPPPPQVRQAWEENLIF